MMITPLRIGLMGCTSLLVACGSDATREDALVAETSAYAAEADAMADAAIAMQPAQDAGTADADTATGSDTCDALTYANTGKPFFASYCAGCHRLPQPTFNDLDEVTNMKPRIQARLFATPTAPMPPPYVVKQPSAEEKRTLQQWLQCDPLD